MQQDLQASSQDAEMTRFLNTHRPAIADLVEQAYAGVGGHYAQMTPGVRHQQAQIDAGEIIDQIISGVVHQAAIENSIQAIPSLATLTDVVRMAEAVEHLINGYVQQELADNPELARKIVSRMNNASRRFRMNISAAYAERVRIRIEKPPAS